MIYKHDYFQLDTDSKKVFDENGKELLLTGNAYRMLVFLCANRNATLTQIGDFLDWAKDYSENHLRQYRYKINTLIGKGIIEYRNGVYSIVGDIENADKLTRNDRNTDLLQQNHVSSSWINFMKKTEKIKTIPAIASIILLLLSFFNWPYGFYSLLRIIVAASSAYYAYYFYSVLKKQEFWFWSLLIILILFNPFIPIYIKNRAIWQVIDIIVSIYYLILIIKLKYARSS